MKQNCVKPICNVRDIMGIKEKNHENSFEICTNINIIRSCNSYKRFLPLLHMKRCWPFWCCIKKKLIAGWWWWGRVGVAVDFDYFVLKCSLIVY